MERYWRPSQGAAWERLIPLRNPRAVMLYHYIESGLHTSRTRVCRCDFTSLCAVTKTSPPTLRKDLETLSIAELIVYSISPTDLVTAYPVGSWLACPPRRERVTVCRMLAGGSGGGSACAAVMAALDDLGVSGATDVQALENKETDRQSKSNQRAIKEQSKPDRTGQDRTGQETTPKPPPPANPTAQAPSMANEKKNMPTDPVISELEPLPAGVTPVAPRPASRLRRRPKHHELVAHAATALLDLYRSICVPAGMADMRCGVTGYSESLLTSAVKARGRNADLFDWEGYFKFCCKSAFLTGKSQPSPGRKRFTGGFVWITGAENQGKIESGTYHEQAPPKVAPMWANNNFPE